MKGIVLAGGSGTRLYPLTKVTSKQLLPIYDKPMIYYPLSTLMLAGIKDILIISTPDDTPRFEALLGDGSQFGISLSYCVQPSPDGLAQAFILGEEFLNGEAGAMILGDNIFYGNGFRTMLKAAVRNAEENNRATVFGYYVPDPERFGVVAFDDKGVATSIEEKPKEPKSNYAVTGLYFYPAGVSDRANKVQPSPDGLAQAFILGEKFLNGEPGAMILGDNIFYGNGFRTMLKAAVRNAEENNRATVFGYYVPDPERFGVVEFDSEGHALSIEEKPKEPKSNYAVTGLYFYPAGVSDRANKVQPSARGELEITTLNEMYLNDGLLDVQLLGRGFAWLDTGTMQSLLQAAEFVEMIQGRQGITISAPEEIAFINGFIGKEKLLESAEAYGKSPYGEHLKAVAEGRVKY